MNTRFLCPSSQKIEKQEPHQVKLQDESTPKKQAFPTPSISSQDHSTVQKAISLGAEATCKTIRRQKKKPKRPWSSKQDELLKELVISKGAKDWATISSYFEDRCGKQCRERWHNHLRSGIKKGDWSYQEEWLLFLGVQAYGKRWSQISRMLEGRTQNTLKNHWNCKMNPKKKDFQQKLSSMITKYKKNLLYGSLTKSEFYLLQMILDRAKTKDQTHLKKEQQENQLLAKFLEKALRDFYELKREVYRNFNVQMDENQQRTNRQIHMEWEKVESFGKIKYVKEEKQIFIRQSRSDIEESDDEQSRILGRNYHLGFEAVSESLKIEKSIKDISNMGDEVFDTPESDHQEESMSFDRRIGRSGGQNKSTNEGFYSPLRRKMFQGIDLGESNTKKKLFQ